MGSEEGRELQNEEKRMGDFHVWGASEASVLALPK